MKNQDRKSKRKDDGFTLVEMMAVLMIIGLLMSVVIFSIAGNADDARVGKAKADIRNYETALELFYLDIGSYPPEEYGLEALVSLPQGLDSDRYRDGGYIKKIEEDPWGQPYIYIQPGEEGRKYEIISYGGDGQPGGEGIEADITSYE